MRARLAAVAVLAVLALPALAAGARAATGPAASPVPPPSLTLVSKTSFQWLRDGVPDVDQVRVADAALGLDGLPGDGKMYCVPTALANVLSYLGQFGFDTGIAFKDWTLQPNWNEVVAELLQLGAEMSTSAGGGTGGKGFYDALLARLTKFGSGSVPDSQTLVPSFAMYGAKAEWLAPDPKVIARTGLAGGFVLPVIGYYSAPFQFNGKTVIKRNGGHMMTAVGAAGDWGSLSTTITVRDPATDYVSDSVQTPYANDVHTLTPTKKDVRWTNSNGQFQVSEVSLQRWDGSDTTLFEGYAQLVPKQVWGFVDKELVEINPFGPGSVERRFAVPGKPAPVDLALNPISQQPSFITPSAAYALDPLLGTSKKIADTPGARGIAFGGPQPHMFVAYGRKLAEFEGNGFKRMRTRTLSAPLIALEFDERTQRLIGLEKGGRTLVAFGPGLKMLGGRSLPAVQKGGDLAILGDGSVAVANLGDGTVFKGQVKTFGMLVGKGGSSARSAAAPGRPKWPSVVLKRGFMAPVAAAGGFTVDDLGQFFTADGGQLHVLARSGKRVAATRFKGRLRGIFAVTRAFSNFDPASFPEALDFLPADPAPKPTTPAPPPPPRPDLIVVRGSDRQLAVRNIGGAASGATTLRITNPALSFAVPALAPGEQSVFFVTPCGATRVATADADGAVTESDEANNAATLTCTP